ncbi:MAG TPA: hypothetical protein DCM08_06220 [Microscillaceae bacterium]|jgi:hypothetical protein|nr:hypothetical protein [Microscillaceae bacterium]
MVRLSYFLLFLLLVGCAPKERNVDSLTTSEIYLIEKYSRMQRTFDHYLVQTLESNNQLRKEIVEQAKGDTLLLRRVKQLDDQTRFVIKFLSFAKAYLYNNLGKEYDKQRAYLKQPYEVEKAEKYLIGDNKNGEGYNLEKKINAFFDFLNKEFKDFEPAGYVPLTKIEEGDPLSKDRIDLQKRDFVEQKFKGMPVIGAMAVIGQMQLEILVYETQILNRIAQELPTN